MFDVRDPRFHDVIPSDAALERLETGFVFTEGPIWHPDAHFLVFSDIATSTQYRWSEGEGLTIFRKPSNQANGNCFDKQGRVVSCEHAASQVVRHDHDGKLISVLASHFDGKALNSPNDVVCDQLGRLWFTDPGFGRTREDLGILRPQEQPFQGVYRLDPDGTLDAVVTDFDQPNGLCLSLDEAQLYVNDSANPHIRRFDIEPDGGLTGGAVWAEVTGDVVDPVAGRKWVPDGMKLSIDGHLFCNGPGGVHVFDADAVCLGVILMPEKSTNFCFGGESRQDLYITASTALYRIPTRTSGPKMI
ncbi:MAG: SMP-30/gluconolactonase/LRE family protein [Pseudomonadota bacterium]